MATRMTSKGQITVPKKVRDRMGLRAGSEVEIALGEGGEYVLRKAGRRRKPPTDPIDRARGSLALGMTTDEFMKFLRGEPDERLD
jgi:AbrB family looped-hinge helix DNA binding protein